MAATVTLELPESVLVQALKRLPPARRRQIWLSLEVDSVAAQHDSVASGRGKTRTLDKALGLLAVGQAAPTDAEIAQLLEERRSEKYG
ncbi:MAG: hypothetical protein ACKO4U_03480 [Caldilinea sp.]|jgi:hypothetical protein